MFNGNTALALNESAFADIFGAPANLRSAEPASNDLVVHEVADADLDELVLSFLSACVC